MRRSLEINCILQEVTGTGERSCKLKMCLKNPGLAQILFLLILFFPGDRKKRHLPYLHHYSTLCVSQPEVEDQTAPKSLSLGYHEFPEDIVAPRPW